MVSNQKPMKNWRPNGKEITNINNTNDLQKEINDVLNVCKEIITSNNSFMKQNASKIKSIQPMKSEDKSSEITLEKVAQDMTNILKDLKDHLPAFKRTKDSFSDVVPKLEASFVRRNQKVDSKGESSKTCKPETSGNNQNNRNASAKSGNRSNKTNAVTASVPQQKTNNVKPKSAETSKKDGKGRPMSAPGPQNCSNNNKRPMSGNTNPVKPSTASNATTNKGPKQVITPNLNNPNKRTPPRACCHPLELIKGEVQKAIRERKTFTVAGNYPAIRNSLLERGWMEKLHVSCYNHQANEKIKKFRTYSIQQLAELLWNKENADVCKKLIQSKMLLTHQVDFYWSNSYNAFKDCPDKIKLTKINRIRRDVVCYSSKLGLCQASKKAAWFRISGLATLNHPRTYSLTKNGDTPEFIKDFKRTAAMSLLKWVVKNNSTGQYKVLSPSGKIPIGVFDFAINECYKFIKQAEHEDINNEIKEALEYEWTEFIEYFYKTIHIGNHFKKNDDVSEIDMVRKANFILKKINDFWPYLDMDGMMNLWILKPISSSQGVGIHICRTLQYILKTVQENPNRVYIIQKYIERPFLIHNTKFDIRQWFLISSCVPLTIWMYKQCYLRFSSQTYNLRKLHESIHLTNNSVQCRYKKFNRDIALPSYDMWYLKEFKDYLSDIGYPNVFDTIIYPGMKQNIIASVIMYHEKLEKRKNCFELYGADFMVTEDFKPWLLEINSNPALHASTPVTAKMCPQVLRDVIKVVIDYEANKSANTGDFQLIYQNDLSVKDQKVNLQIQGTPVTNNYFYTSSQNGAKPSQALVKPENIAAPSFQNMPSIDAIDYVKHIGKGMRKTLQDLLEVLKKEKEKRHKRKNKSVITILSHIITETKESQTEYRDQDKPSERLNMLQILEVDGSEATNVNKANIEKPVPDKANRVEINAEKAKGEMKGKVTRNAPQKKTNKNRKLVQNVNKTKTAIQSKEEINKKCEEKRKQVNATGQSKLPLENTEETKMVHQSKSDEYEKKTNATMLQLHENTDDAKPTLQSKEAKTIINVEPEINENLKQCGLGNKTQAIIQSKLNINEALKENKKETETAIRSKLNINANHRENTKEIKSITRFKANINQSERERKILQTMSDIIEKRNEYKTKIFPHSRSDIIEILQDKFREAKPSIHSQSCTNEKLQGNTMEIKTILPCRSKINESSIKHENIRKDNSIIQSRSNINEESEDSEENDKETAIYQFKSDITEKHEENEKQKSETKQETETVAQTTSDMNEKSPKNRNEQKTIPQSNSRYKQTELETDRKDSAIVTITDDNFNLFDDAENLEFNYNGSKLSRLLMLSNDEKAKGAMGTLSSKAIRTKNDLKSNLSKTNDTAHPESKGCDTTELNENVRRRTFLSFFLRSAKRM